jgi:hypothetical protein
MDTRRILWFAIVMSTVIYAVIAFTIAGSPQRSFEENVKQPMTLGLYAAAFSMFVAGLVFSSVSKAPPQTAMIITLAIFESCAIFGLLAAFLSSDWRLYIPAWIVALIGFIRQFPSSP